MDKSEAVGERLKEAQHINRSLSALGDVNSALAQNSTHIPLKGFSTMWWTMVVAVGDGGGGWW